MGTLGPPRQPLVLQKGKLRPKDRSWNGLNEDPEPPFLSPSQKSALIKLANIRAAEKVEEKSFGSSHVMQVIYTDDTGRPQTAYLQCKVWPRGGGTLGEGCCGWPLGGLE